RKDDHGNRIGCMSDVECAFDDPTQPDLGYCDLETFTCVEGCRRGPDWRDGCSEPFLDCKETHKCVMNPATLDPALGICEEKDCHDLGGADAACQLGEFCGNEPHRDPLTGAPSHTEFVPPPPGVGG